jgi:hypothetical protein
MLTLEQEMYCRVELITTAIELIAAETLGITDEELSHYYWL